jgi:hypothetical protein
MATKLIYNSSGNVEYTVVISNKQVSVTSSLGDTMTFPKRSVWIGGNGVCVKTGDRNYFVISGGGLYYVDTQRSVKEFRSEIVPELGSISYITGFSDEPIEDLPEGVNKNRYI